MLSFHIYFEINKQKTISFLIDFYLSYIIVKASINNIICYYLHTLQSSKVYY